MPPHELICLQEPANQHKSVAQAVEGSAGWPCSTEIGESVAVPHPEIPIIDPRGPGVENLFSRELVVCLFCPQIQIVRSTLSCCTIEGCQVPVRVIVL